MKKPPKQRLKEYKEETPPLPSWLPRTEVQPEPHPQRVPTQPIKSTKVKGPSFMNNIVSYQRKYTNELLSLWIDNTSSSNTILFLAFQTNQKRHSGPTLQTSSLSFFFSHKRPVLAQKCRLNCGWQHPLKLKKREKQCPKSPCLGTMKKNVIY